MRLLLVSLGLGLVLAGPGPSSAELTPRIDRIALSGNKRVDDESIRIQLRSQAGTRLNEETVDNDVRTLYRMGFFDRIEVDWSQQNGQWVLTFQVVERPFIHEVKMEGEKHVSKDDLEGAFKIRPNTILDPQKIRHGIDEAKKLYEKKGYLDANITYSTDPLPNDEVTLKIKLEEGDIVRISNLDLEGAKAFSKSKLLGLMQTKEKWFLSWVTGAGNLDNEVLKTDIERLTAFYYDNGYIDVKIDEPKVERQEDGLHVTIKIDEGEQYNTGTVEIAGDTLPDMTQAQNRLNLKPGETFRTSKLRDDINMLTEVYGDQGYAFVNINPDTVVNSADRKVDITYRASKGPEVSIDKVTITGNTKTRDKVIRRELRLQEQERFAGSKLKRSQERLRRLGYFEDVNITTRKAQGEDKLDLLVDVKEASTGSFSAGAGISSGESYLFNVRLQEINFMGKGQRVVLNADLGSIRRNFSLDFTEPYLLDTDLTFGLNLFNWRLQFNEFTRGGTGAAFRLLYPLPSLGYPSIFGFSLEDTRVGLEYRIENAEITDVSTIAPASIHAEQGSSLTSSITPRLFRDTRNHPFDPTAGSLQDLSFEFAGIGGDSKFYKFEARGRWYYPFLKSDTLGTFVFASGANFGYGHGYDGQTELPLFERYFPGGINSVRGFRILSLGQRVPTFNQYGTSLGYESIGGSQQLIFNEEMIFPIVESLGLKGVVFFDAGNAFLASQGIDFNDIRMATGGGIRWLSPIGPLRIEVGFPLNPRVGDDEQTIMFSFGGPP
ncbi:MAG TPA: outer membrane protein assembly factor BamA [Candidatus Acidoferrales bacterium]|nr:outer membrane protein assembly factor BamA [Candidatus Acidoferrales bacterium]